MHSVRGKRVTVVGLGRFGGGIAVSRWLVEHGAMVIVTDRDPAEKLASSVAQLSGLPIQFHLGEHRAEDFVDTDLIVTSPAVQPASAFLQSAVHANVPITTEICLFVERCPAPIVGITGTKGKSTTTALLGRMLETRFRTWVGGNIGGSLLVDLPRIGRDDVVVLELSSYMLHYLGPMHFSPNVAVVTMMSRDHVEWHGSAEAYLDAKLNILRFQKATDIAVLNFSESSSKPFLHSARSQIVNYGGERRALSLRLPGQHNQLNAQAALAAAMSLGVSFEAAEEAVRDFEGLPHRLQVVHQADGVSWVNDSIATIPEAAAAALRAFPKHRVIQIVGGSDKQLPMDAMIDALADHAKAVLCIGQTGPKVSAALRGRNGSLIVCDCQNLKAAVAKARSLTSAGDVVLLSTGYASYDQFQNFEKRGEMFCKLAKDENVTL